jgi:hypothetical protein
MMMIEITETLHENLHEFLCATYKKLATIVALLKYSLRAKEL